MGDPCRWGATGQGKLLCDIHSALIRILEGLDEDLMEAPTMAGYGSAADLAPQDAYRPLLGASWPELARRYLQDQGVLTISQDAVQAALNLKARISQHSIRPLQYCLMPWAWTVMFCLLAGMLLIVGPYPLSLQCCHGVAELIEYI